MASASLLAAAAAALCAAMASHAQVQDWSVQRAKWNVAEKPRRIFGNSYSVGTQGLGSILITSDQGHVLIDGALPESVPLIVANIRELGFRVEDVKLILNSHAHFDHSGGIPELQKLSGATVAASPWSARVLETGEQQNGDPQLGMHAPIPKVSQPRTIRDGETLRVGPLALTAHFTPGHTPGGTSWSWTSCEAQRCQNIVYADSVSAVSSDSYRFTDHADVMAGFEKSFAALRALPCDILLIPHPEWMRDLKSPGACASYVDMQRERLQKRIAAEKQR